MNERSIKEAKLAELKNQLLTVEGTPTEVYSRIVGYYRSVRNWNVGKRHEYSKRKTYELDFSANEMIQPQAQPLPMNTPLLSLAHDNLNVKQGMAEAYLLFTRETCPGCGPVKEYLQGSGLKATIVDVDTPDGLEKARQYNVMATPTAILFSGKGEEKVRAYNRSQLAGFLGNSATTPQLSPSF
ncbi:MAG: hypothetical protein KKI09_00765 [Spirochaetes bacterium]|nr:hypothetical protein [Spirochaetota bacterium]MBU0953931.1 hypothetical protein [Spirochaetota bacterium]